MLSEVIEGCGVEERTDPGLMQERIRTEVRRLPAQANRPAAAGAAGRHGDLNVPTVARVPGSALSRRLSEVVGVGLFAVSLIWLVALASYDAGDPAWFFSTGTNDAPANFAGRVGAFLAELSFQLLGYASFLIPAVVAIVAWRYFWCRPVTAAYTKLTGALLIFGCRQRLSGRDHRARRLRAARVSSRRLRRRVDWRVDGRLPEPHRLGDRAPGAHVRRRHPGDAVLVRRALRVPVLEPGRRPAPGRSRTSAPGAKSAGKHGSAARCWPSTARRNCPSR